MKHIAKLKDHNTAAHACWGCRECETTHNIYSIIHSLTSSVSLMLDHLDLKQDLILIRANKKSTPHSCLSSVCTLSSSSKPSPLFAGFRLLALLF